MSLAKVRKQRKQDRLDALRRWPDPAPPTPGVDLRGRGIITGQAPSHLQSAKLYTDGSCQPNPGIGGWGCVIMRGAGTWEISGNDPSSTNQRMELTAAIRALRFLQYPCNVLLFTDSKYVIGGMTGWIASWQKNGWRTSSNRPVQNRDLWEALIHEAERHEIRWLWIKGHSGHSLNSRADYLARMARRDLQYR